LSERRRAFSSLRLTGMPLNRLRRVVGLENAVPVLAGSVVSIGIGFLAAHLFLESQLGYALVAPGPGYYLAVVGGIAGALAIVASTLPFLARVTGPEASRND
jgi:ABC-type antimicrobial peptide transport system permease subunit